MTGRALFLFAVAYCGAALLFFRWTHGNDRFSIFETAYWIQSIVLLPAAGLLVILMLHLRRPSLGLSLLATAWVAFITALNHWVIAIGSASV